MTRRLTSARARAGFTLLEVLIAITILGMIAANVVMVTRSSSKAYESGASLSTLDIQLDNTMDRIAMALMAARKESLTPNNPSPLWTDFLIFDQSQGFEGGMEVIGDLERIELVPGPEQIVWKQRPGALDERRVVWTNWVLNPERPDVLAFECLRDLQRSRRLPKAMQLNHQVHVIADHFAYPPERTHRGV